MSLPREISSMALEELRATRTMMRGIAWDVELEDEDEATQKESAQCLFKVQRAIRKLENSKLKDIQAALTANEDDLNQHRQTLADARKKVEDVASILNAAGRFLEVVGKVVKLLI